MTTEFSAIFGRPDFESEDLTAWVLKKREPVVEVEPQEPADGDEPDNRDEEPDDRDYDDVDIELYLEHYPDGDRDDYLEY